jgi:hypothetical protein
MTHHEYFEIPQRTYDHGGHDQRVATEQRDSPILIKAIPERSSTTSKDSDDKDDGRRK